VSIPETPRPDSAGAGFANRLRVIALTAADEVVVSCVITTGWDATVDAAAGYQLHLFDGHFLANHFRQNTRYDFHMNSFA
jgi:hypothetical protein